MLRSGIVDYYKILIMEGRITTRDIKGNFVEGRLTREEYEKVLELYDSHTNYLTLVNDLNRSKIEIKRETRGADSEDYFNPLTDPSLRKRKR